MKFRHWLFVFGVLMTMAGIATVLSYGWNSFLLFSSLGCLLISFAMLLTPDDISNH